MTPEGKIKKEIIKYLENRGAKVVNIVASMLTKRGQSDLIVCYRGLYLEFETKSLVGQPTKMQRYQGSVTQKAGGHWSYPRAVEEVKKVCDQIDSQYASGLPIKIISD